MNHRALIRPTREPIADPGVVWDQRISRHAFFAIVERM
jgi:hypothetical protein